MPRLSKEEHEGYMKAIMDRYDNPDEAAEMITALRNDFDASVETIDAGQGNELEEANARYNSLREKYIERFFGGDVSLAEAKEKQTEDIKNESKPLTYEALFEKAETYDGKDDE